MTQKKKIAVLGGGVSAMAAAYHLTSRPGWDAHYEVTVYQLGWRLGGKGASGRNAGIHERIEEHGLHVWGGFYENAFALMRACYQELGRPHHAPLATVEQAFLKQSFVVWQEELSAGRWAAWPTDFPENSDVPGTGGELPSLWAYVETLVGWMVLGMRQFPAAAVRARARAPVAGAARYLPAWLRQTVIEAEQVWRRTFDETPFWLLREAAALVKGLVGAGEALRVGQPLQLVDYLESFMRWLREQINDAIWGHDEARRLYIFMELGLGVIKGLVVDGVFLDGFGALDDYDLRDWLRRHGVPERVVQSAPVRAYYDYFFAYFQGDTNQPSLSAGMGLNHLLRLVAGYKGALFWKLAAGMGDVVFAPMYEVMRRRGVKFEFFHMVEGLELDDAHQAVERVRIARQVAIKGGGAYEPLVDVKGLPCWPSAPLWDQIEGGEALRAAGVNLEDRFSDWTPVEEVVLKRGEDFDVALLGISIGEFPYICEELLRSDPDWRIMVDQVPSIQTIALQLWFKPDRVGLGWTLPTTVMTAYAQPIETWSDMTHVIGREAWPVSLEPGNIAYYCGPLTTPPLPPRGHHPEFGPSQLALAREIALGWLSQNLNHLFPKATMSGDPHAVNWALLVDQDEGVGLARFDAQYLRANYTPTERYVISPPGTNRFRMTADTSGYENLALCGDWLYTGLGGSVEGAVVSGMQASRAICGWPRVIVGEVAVNPWQRPRTLKAVASLP